MFYSNLIQSILQVSNHFKDDPPVTQSLNKMANSLQETVKYHSILLDQASRTISRSMNNFLKKYSLKKPFILHFFTVDNLIIMPLENWQLLRKRVYHSKRSLMNWTRSFIVMPWYRNILIKTTWWIRMQHCLILKVYHYH